jgi:hydrogenase-4 component B
VENIGIILLGLGVGVLGSAYGHPAVAFLGYAGALLHTLNHALFKSLLFLGAGAVVRATGTREIDRLGGLARPMPGTALAFLVGAVAIVGLPPLNGFVSEWVIFQGLLEGGASRGAMRGAIVGVAGLALTGALALACFTKLYGTLFLGRPRDARLPDGPMIETGLCGPQFALAAACVLLGVIPAVAVVPAVTVTRSLLPLSLGPASLPPPIQGIGQVTLMALGVVGLVLLLALLNGSRLGRLTRPTVPTWACAYPRGSGRMQYTAASYASPLLQAFGPLSGIRQERGPTAMRGHPFDLVLDVFGRPAWGLVQAAATRLRVLQAGRIRWYLLYLVLTLLALLLFLRSAPLR